MSGYPKTKMSRSMTRKNDQELLLLLTNNMSWTADTISQLYKSRWAIEIFFKTFKTYFISNHSSEQPKMQYRFRWCSLIAILLLSYIKAKAIYDWHLSNLVSLLKG